MTGEELVLRILDAEMRAEHIRRRCTGSGQTEIADIAQDVVAILETLACDLGYLIPHDHHSYSIAFIPTETEEARNA